MPRIYIAGPMTGLPELNFPAFFAKEAELNEHKYHVINPARMSKGLPRSRESYLRADIKALVDCDAIYFLPGWEDSPGACLEYHIAKELKLVVLGTFTGKGPQCR